MIRYYSFDLVVILIQKRIYVKPHIKESHKIQFKSYLNNLILIHPPYFRLKVTQRVSLRSYKRSSIHRVSIIGGVCTIIPTVLQKQKRS